MCDRAIASWQRDPLGRACSCKLKTRGSSKSSFQSSRGHFLVDLPRSASPHNIDQAGSSKLGLSTSYLGVLLIRLVMIGVILLLVN